MKLAVIGGREFNDHNFLWKVMDFIHGKTPITLVISGGAKGADKYGELWADKNSVEKLIHYPDWDTHKKIAGFLRNTDIVQDSDIVLAMWNKTSRGTADSLRKAFKFNKGLWVFDHTEKRPMDMEEVKKYLDAIK